MSDLRAPDPTLTAMGHRAVTVVEDHLRPLLEAHDKDCAHAWGPRFMAASVAYQAIPCRECFPDAPPPGQRLFEAKDTRPVTWGFVHDPHLSWQTGGDV